MGYKVGIGHDVALLSLNEIVPQPRTPGMQSARRTRSGDRTVYDEGMHVPLIFDVLQGATMVQSLLSQFGLDTARSADVTVYIRDDQFQWVRMNGIAERPQIGQDGEWRDFFPRQFEIIIGNLVQAA